ATSLTTPEASMVQPLPDPSVATMRYAPTACSPVTPVPGSVAITVPSSLIKTELPTSTAFVVGTGLPTDVGLLDGDAGSLAVGADPQALIRRSPTSAETNRNVNMTSPRTVLLCPWAFALIGGNGPLTRSLLCPSHQAPPTGAC